MSYYLIEIHTNWADEMDIDGFEVKTEEEYQEWKQGWDKLKGESVEVYIGTNEEVDISFDDFEIREISEDEYNMLTKIDLLSFGHTSLMDAYDYGNDDLDEDEDDYLDDDNDDLDEDEDDYLDDDNDDLDEDDMSWDDSLNEK